MINYTESFNFKPIASITPASDYWQNGTWKFNMPEITVGTGESPSWQDIILSGNTALTLTNAIANGLNYLKLFGGTEQRNLPSGYTQVEYLESDGNQYINTGYAPNVNTEVKINFSMTTLPSTDAYMFHSSDGGSARISLAITQHLAFFGGDLNDSGNRVTLSSFTENTAYDITANKDKTIVNGTEYTFTHTSVTLPTMYSMGLFGTRTGGLKCQGKVKSFSCNENNVLKINLIPCRRNSDNVLGMYDTVSNTFLTNAGTGTFIAGADVTTPSPDYPMDIVSNNGVVKVSKNLFDYRYFYSNYTVPSTSTVGRVAIKLLPNTNYTVSTNTQQSSTAAQVWTDTGSNPSAFSPVTNTNGVLIDTPRTVQSDSNGYIILAIRVGTEYEIKESDFESGNVWVQIEQGSTVTPYAPYSPNGIYTDGTTETVEVTGKNLFDPNQEFEEGYIDDNGNLVTLSLLKTTTGYIKVSPSTTYNISYIAEQVSISNFNISLWTDDDIFISRVARHNIENLGVYSANFTTTSTTAKIKVTIWSNDTIYKDFQLEQGSTATTYEPYYYGGTATAENLFKVGTYQDEQSVIDGGVTRKVGIKVLDGTEDWTFVTGSSAPYSLVISDFDTNAPSASVNVISTHLQGIANSASWQSYDNKITSAYNAIRIGISAITSLADFKQWLSDQYNAGFPVIVVYPLATATTETVTGQPLTTQAGTNIVEITQSAIDNLELEVSFKQSTI